MDDHNDKPELYVVPPIPEKIIDGRDELNFAEFPLGTVAERMEPGTKTLTFEDKIFDKSRNEVIARKLTITGSDAYGLPTSTDDEVLLGLIQLSKLQKFSDRRVYFSRYQLIQLLRWPVTGQSYDRIDQALNRWIGVTLYYQNAWRDKATNSWVDEKFHILEHVKIYSQENEKNRPKPATGQGSFEFAASFFVWNEALFKNFTHGSLKALDYDFVLGLRSSITRRLYRFLDKRFFQKKVLEFELKSLSYEHVGLSRKTPVGDLKRKLGAAIDELVDKGYLTQQPKEKRFTKIRAGIWKVHFIRAQEGQGSRATDSEPEKEAQNLDFSPLEMKVIGIGVSEEKAKKLTSRYSAESIEEKIAILEFLLAKNDPKVSKNPAGFLIRSIEQQFQKPKDYVSASELKEKVAAKAKREQEKLAREERRARQEEVKEMERQKAIDTFWSSMSPEMREAQEKLALQKGDRFQVDLVAKGGVLGKAARQSILNNYALSQLADG